MKAKVLYPEFQASRFVASIEMLLNYKHSHHKLKYAIDWINDNKTSDNNWDFGSLAKDYIYFPISDSWRNKQSIIEDMTTWVNHVLSKVDM